MGKMTDSRAADLLAEVSSTLPTTHLHAERLAAIRHAIARLREPAGVPALIVDHVTDSHAWPLMNLPSGTRLYAAPQPPAEAHEDEVVCLECGQPTMHMGQVCYACLHPADDPAEAQAQVGGEVCAHHWHDYGQMNVSWCRKCEAKAVTGYEDRPFTTPPSAPVGVDDSVLEHAIDESDGDWHDGEFFIDGPALMNLLRSVAQKPAAVVGSCCHSWHDYGQVNRSWCRKCNALAVTGYEDQPYAIAAQPQGGA